MGMNVFGIDDKLKALKKKSPVLGELVKQAIDQPLHVLMTVASVWAIGYVLTLVGASVTLAGVLAGVLTAAWVGVREYLQWPSSRWWDPYLDWLFEAGGLALGIWSFFAGLS
jgi:hypothetical protein